MTTFVKAVLALALVAVPFSAQAFGPKQIEKQIRNLLHLPAKSKAKVVLTCTDFNGYYEGTCENPEVPGAQEPWGLYVSQETCDSIHLIYASLNTVMGISYSAAEGGSVTSTNLSWSNNRTMLVNTNNGSYQDHGPTKANVGYDSNVIYALSGTTLRASGTINYRVVQAGGVVNVSYPVSCTAVRR